MTPEELVLDDSVGVPTWPMLALGKYRSELRRVILAAKHDPVRELSEFLLEAGRSLGRSVSTQSDLQGGTRIWVVPAPSSKSRERSRTEIVPTVARGVVQGIVDGQSFCAEGNSVSVELVRAVRLSSRPVEFWRFSSSQQGKGARARGMARSGTMELALPVPRGVRVVVVDDVCASGATLREVLRVLGDAAAAVVVIAAS